MSAAPKIVIIGAGPTGLGAAYRLAELGHDDFVVLEAASGVGGLAASFVDEQGFTWDVGGHVQFSHFDYYDQVLDRALGATWLEHDRESWIWIAEGWVPYPFQYNLHRLPMELRNRALAGLESVATRKEGVRPASFRDWIFSTFGEGIAEIFLNPYNRKVWGFPLDEIDVGWMGERVAVPDLERVRGNILAGRDDVSWGPNNRFRFPARGGTGAIWTAVAKLLPEGRLKLGRRVREIDLGHRCLTTSTGELFEFDRLISTMPLDHLAACIVDVPSAMRGAAAGLRHSAVHILGIGLRGGRPETLRHKCWMYFPESHSPYYRVTVFSNYSPANVPEGAGYWSLMAEVCESAAKPVDSDALLAWCVDAMRRDQLLEPEAEIVSLWHRREEHGYPTPFLGRERVLGALLPVLESSGVQSRGRFGAWRYEVSNQDHCFMQGVEAANRLLLGAAEVTVRGSIEPSVP